MRLTREKQMTRKVIVAFQSNQINKITNEKKQR